MPTRNIVPNNDNEGNIGSALKRWIKGWFADLFVSGTISDGVDSVTVNQLAGAISTSAVFTPTINGTTMKEVSQESDFGTAVGGVITLQANTTYFVRGVVECTNRLSVVNPNIAIIGWDRDKDGLKYIGTTGAGDFITITDTNCELNNIRLSSTNSLGNDVVVRATNVNYGAFNDGRSQKLTIINCVFRDTYDVLYIEGFDLCDIQNTLFWYIKATSVGCQFRNVSKLQISSCEFVRWFDETTIPTPSGWALVPQIELLDNGVGNGFGAVNINGGIYHPQQTQDGIRIDPNSTTGFGTISGNAFINIGLTTGVVFNPVNLLNLPDYSQTATLRYDVFANQGVLNSTSGVLMTVTNNTTVTGLTAATPIAINTGGGAVLRAAVRYNVTAAGRATYTGTKQKFVSIHASIAFQKQGGGTDSYIFSLYQNGVLLAGSEADVLSGGSTADSTLSINYGTLMNQNDYIELYVENPLSADGILIKDLQLVIRE
jgi:hypothetical protein